MCMSKLTEWYTKRMKFTLLYFITGMKKMLVADFFLSELLMFSKSMSYEHLPSLF